MLVFLNCISTYTSVSSALKTLCYNGSKNSSNHVIVKFESYEPKYVYVQLLD
jgi:hypothetical protein